MKILLATLNSKYIHSNLAIRLLYAINKHHEGLAWKEFTIKENKDEIATYCSEYQVIAFSCYIWNITQTLEVCRKIKSLNPDIKILLGGPEVSYEYEDVIVKDEVDFIIVGEGEIPFSRFVESYPKVETIPGIVSKKNSQILYLPNPETFDLNLLQDVNPYAFDPVDELRTKVLYIETSRGCPYKCEFCLASLDNKVRYLPIERIKENLAYVMRYGKTIKFLDRTFNIKKDFTLDIFGFILQHHQKGNVFQFEITADILHADIIKFVQEKVPKGLFRFEIGIQTVNQKANLEVSRKQNFYKTKSIIEQVQDYVDLHLDLIVGLPLDYWEDIKFSIEEVFKLYPPELQLGFLKFLKGTPVRERYEQYNYKFDPEPPYQIIESDYLSADELYQITQLEFALEAYWNKKRIPRTLIYITETYSIFDFLLGLGQYFASRSDYHRHTLFELFEVVNDYLDIHFKEDKQLKIWFALDYYLYHKIKPKPFILDEIEKKEKFNWLEQQKLNHHAFRYVVFDLPEGIELKGYSKRICVEYNGQYAPRLVENFSVFT
jgi:anaerobic magnesium-protoporphyrin IX monomethyl ester cyclase